MYNNHKAYNLLVLSAQKTAVSQRFSVRDAPVLSSIAVADRGGKEASNFIRAHSEKAI
jgi:hypothetical protein